MIFSLILLIVGFLVIFLEFFVPGGILGILGGIILLISIINFAMNSEYTLLTLLYIVVLSVAFVFVVKFALWRLKHGKFKNSFYSDKDQEGYVAANWDRSLIGKEGVVDTDLKPGGYILIDGKRYQALSQSGYASKNEKVRVLGGEGETLIVVPTSDV